MNNLYQTSTAFSITDMSTDLRRYGAVRRSQAQTLASRKICRQHGLSPSYARLIAELAGLNG